MEYNPLYLVSALLVLGGVMAIARATAESGAELKAAGVVAITEVYAWALIGGAAVLQRLGLRRPAVMLALLTALYQCDLTLLTERQVYLGFAGALATAVWLSMFVAKLQAIAWVMKLRLSRSALLVPAFGALGMAVLPHLVDGSPRDVRHLVVAAWSFVLFAAGLFTRREVTSRVTLDAWGETVLGRSRKAIWTLWSVAALGHVLFWCSQYDVSTAALLPSALLLSTRWMRREASVWVTVTAIVVITFFGLPEAVSLVSLLAAATLLLRAFRKPTRVERGPSAAPEVTPYRASAGERAEATPPPVIDGFTRSEGPALIRLLGGAMFGLYLSAWTLGWEGAPLPHVIWLDLALLFAAAILAWRARSAVVALPPALVWFHAGVQLGLIVGPASTLEWGVSAVGAGFVLLAGSLLVAWRLRAPRDPDTATG